MDGQAIIPAPERAGGYTELSRNATGTTFRKHILNLGTLIHPVTKEKLALDDAWYSQLKQNFENGVCDIVAVPLANAKNEHVEDPLSNAGEVVGISRDGDKVFVDLDIRRPDVVKGLKDKTLLGASAYLHMNYTDTRTGKKVGPTLLHSCITNRPYVVGLGDYEEVVAATSDGTGDVVMLTPDIEEHRMDKAELIAALRDEHGIDVEALQEAASDRSQISELSAALTAAIQGNGAPADTLALTGPDGDEVDLRVVVGAVAELAQLTRSQEAELGVMRRERAEKEVEGYIAEGRITPAKRETYVELALSNRETLVAVLPDKPAVPLNRVSGYGEDEEGRVNSATGDIDKEIARLTNPDAPTGKFFAGKQ
jgi:hypothetical protein